MLGKCDECKKADGICKIQCDRHKTHHIFCVNCLIANFTIVAEMFEMGVQGMTSIIYSNKCCYGVKINERNVW